ncbi:MAG: hypothetical protein IKJ91_04750 [Clostridia bacterium]|nr:hypothetical protein [Clostridia bacterium]
MGKFKNNIEAFAVGYMEAEHDDVGYRISSGMLNQAKHHPLSLDENAFFAGKDLPVPRWRTDGPQGVRNSHGNGFVVREDMLLANIKKYPEFAYELKEIYEYFKGKDTTDMVNAEASDLARSIAKNKLGWGGGQYAWTGGHGNPDYGLIIRNGTDGLRRKINDYKAKNPEKIVFYEGLLLTLDAIDIYAERYGKMAKELAKKCDGEQKKRLLRIASALDFVPKRPARDFFEACQSFWLLFTVDGIDSPGRFDQYMIDCYRASEEEDRRECLEELWQLFHSARAWNLCIGGTDENWQDEANELSYAILEVARKYKYNTPNITMRVSRNTPKELLISAAMTIATGIGMPSLYNDEVVCAALEKIGIPPCDSHDYCMNGCNQIDIFGKSHMGLEDGEVCLAKCLEGLLFEGRNQISGEVMMPSAGDPCSFDTYEELFEAYKKMVELVTDEVTEMANITQRICAEHSPNPMRSVFIEGCIEKGLDYKNKGPLYGHAQILAEGIGDTVDSLAALKYFVYDTKKYKMDEIIKALEANFEGYEELWHDLDSFPKFGNDDPYVDEIYRNVTEHFNRYLQTKKAFRGGIFTGGCSTFQRAASYGIALGAMPSGKKRGDARFADSIGAVPGCDTKGPTALIKSVTNADHTLACSGNVLQMKFAKSVFGTEKGMDAFISLAKTYFSLGGQQLSINVVSKEELLDAKKHPERHKDLVVRVGGYSDYFNNLEEGLKDNIIERTMLGL